MELHTVKVFIFLLNEWRPRQLQVSCTTNLDIALSDLSLTTCVFPGFKTAWWPETMLSPWTTLVVEEVI